MLHKKPEPSKHGAVIDLTDRDGNAVARAPRMSEAAVVAAANRAARTIAPLWPLESFVAVNPFVGIASLPYADADNTVQRTWGARLVMPRTFYADALRSEQITRAHINRALDELPDEITGRHDIESISAAALEAEPAADAVATIADLISADSGDDWQAFVIDRISAWAAGYFDEGQASWRSPWRGESPFAAWRGEAELDRTPEILGLKGFRGIVRTLPRDADALLVRAAHELGLHGELLDGYLQRLLATIAGWAGHARYRGWRAELAGRSDARVKELLAIRAAWDLALLDAFGNRGGDLSQRLRQGLVRPLHPAVIEAHAVNLVLHTAYEIASREPLLEALCVENADAHAETQVAEPRHKPIAQAVFCIDVRSERYRRMLEAANPRVETMGFAGFFGFALEVAAIDQDNGGAQCPVLLEPQFVVRESAPGASEKETAQLARRTWLGRRLAAAWQQFSAAAVSSFAFVESLGLAYAWKLAADGLSLGGRRRERKLMPDIDARGDHLGIPLAQRVQTARGALAGMSLTEGFAPLVALIGHGATVENNPYASRYNCGACGGHTGEANAAVAARVLNDPDVRAALADDGIDIPVDTWFIAGLHDTTTDRVQLVASADVPASHAGIVREFSRALDDAGAAARRERIPSFGVPALLADADAARRSNDWAEIRPEWGLAGNMAFIAAPRERTRHVDLGGRSFLHSYDCEGDAGFEVLELIMTAPLVVASWISLQYYASTVDNNVFGSGDKTLHNVVGGLGVLEGNGGDLRVGLPLQSLHDGQRWIHEPLRLNAFIEAPLAAIGEVLEKHEHVRELADNGWIHLFAILDEGRTLKRYRGDYCWSDVRPIPESTGVFEVPRARRSA